MVWHRDSDLPKVDLIVLPGGFSYGDYLRSGAMAAHSPIMREVVKRGERRRAGARHLQRLPDPDRGRAAAGRADAQCRPEIRLPHVQPAGREQPDRLHLALCGGSGGARSPSPITTATISPTTIRSTGSRSDGRVAFRYCDAGGRRLAGAAIPTARSRNIAGIFNETKTVLGLMPHPERAAIRCSAARTAGPCSTGWREALALMAAQRERGTGARERSRRNWSPSTA